MSENLEIIPKAPAPPQSEFQTALVGVIGMLALAIDRQWQFWTRKQEERKRISDSRPTSEYTPAEEKERRHWK